MIAILRLETSKNGQLNFFQCGGSLIHPNVVMTAGHCVDKVSISELKARAGEWDTQTKNEQYPHQDRKVHDIVIHEDYYAQALLNDIALLFLEKPFKLTEAIQPVCLPEQDQSFDFKSCIVSGWGKDLYGKEGIYQVILKKLEISIVPNRICEGKLKRTRLSYHFELHESFICAGGEKGKDTCKGDGGSPLVCNMNDQYFQAGIVAWGIGCGEIDVPGVYVNVALFRNWIDQKMIEKGLLVT